MRRIDICIAVCTRNRPERLSEALKSLAGLASSDEFRHHVLVVNNGSNEATEEAICTAKSAFPNLDLRSVNEHRVGFAFARNRATQESDAPWIAFFDDDQLAEPDWLIELWEAAQRNKAVCVGGAVRLKFIAPTFEPGPFCRQMLGETDPEVAEQKYASGFDPGTGNLLVKRSVILGVGGFSTDHVGRGEDSILYARMRASDHVAWFTPRALIHHVIPRERNCPSAYRALAKESSHAGYFGWMRWGWRLPFVGFARLTYAVLVHLPLLCWFLLFGTETQRVDQGCATLFEFNRSIKDLQYGLSRCLGRSGKSKRKSKSDESPSGGTFWLWRSSPIQHSDCARDE